MDEQAEYAVLSKAAYDFFHGGEALAQSELQEYGLGDHSIDEALSDDHAVVITRPDGSAVVSYRGTDAMSDLAPDFQIALGYHHNPMLQSMGAAASQWAGDRFAEGKKEARARHPHGPQSWGHTCATCCTAPRRKGNCVQSGQLSTRRTLPCSRVFQHRLRLFGTPTHLFNWTRSHFLE